MTFKLTSRVIENAKRKGDLTADFIADMTQKLDVFLLNNRITEAEYTILAKELNQEA